MKKYLILDFGKVLAYPTTGHWHITPKFLELFMGIDIDYKKLEVCIKKHSYLTSKKILNLEEEYNMFIEFYNGILLDYNYPNYTRKIAEQIAYNRTYEYDKYNLYENVKEELYKLKEKYILILLSDNWPCGIEFLKFYNIHDVFDKIYISSIYGQEKQDKEFFDNPIKDFNIKPGEAIFIDDNEKNLDIAESKGMDVRLMDRDRKVTKSKHKIIYDLSNIED